MLMVLNHYFKENLSLFGELNWKVWNFTLQFCLQLFFLGI